jgi:hypothetical protein
MDSDKLIFEDLIKVNKAAFIAKVKSVAAYLGVDPNALIFLMWFETGHTLDSTARNKVSGATGLIQFMPSTARFLGTTCEALAAMSNVQQLDYVKKHLGIFKGRYKDWVDLYCGIFWPAAVGKPETYVITPAIVAKQNPLFDIDKDGDIEKAEIRAALLKQIPAQYKEYFT